MKVFKFTAFLMVCLQFSPVQVFSQKIASGPYFQEVSQEIELPLNAGLDPTLHEQPDANPSQVHIGLIATPF